MVGSVGSIVVGSVASFVVGSALVSCSFMGLPGSGMLGAWGPTTALQLRAR